MKKRWRSERGGKSKKSGRMRGSGGAAWRRTEEKNKQMHQAVELATQPRLVRQRVEDCEQVIKRTDEALESTLAISPLSTLRRGLARASAIQTNTWHHPGDSKQGGPISRPWKLIKPELIKAGRGLRVGGSVYLHAALQKQILSISLDRGGKRRERGRKKQGRDISLPTHIKRS